MSEVLVKVLTGSGECAKITWRFLGLSMPGWVLIAALLLGAVGLVGQSAPPSAGAAVLMPDTLALTCDLMSRPSVSPADGGCQALMGERLRRSASASRICASARSTISGRGAARRRPLFCFAGHTDVVPPGPLEEWHSDPFAPVIRDGLLYGRGAADMKSGLAAMLTACEEFIAAYPDHRGSIAFLITSDEEGPSVDGTRRVVEVLRERKESIDWCLVGEPSSETALGDTIKIGRRGSLSGRLTVHGVQGHIAYPQLADNPDSRARARAGRAHLAHLGSGQRAFPAHDFPGVEHCRRHGRAERDPGRAQGALQFALLDRADHRVACRRPWSESCGGTACKYTLDWFISGYPFLTAPGMLSQAAARAVQEELQVTPKLSTGGGTSDGRFIAPTGAQVIELGVVNATIHKANECVRVEDIDRLRRTYRRTWRSCSASARAARLVDRVAAAFEAGGLCAHVVVALVGRRRGPWSGRSRSGSPPTDGIRTCPSPVWSALCPFFGYAMMSGGAARPPSLRLPGPAGRCGGATVSYCFAFGS